MTTRQVLLTAGTAALAILLFALPLLFKFHVYKKSSVQITTTDVIPITERVSTMWCEGFELKMASPFNAFLFSSFPQVDDNLKHSTTIQGFRLPNRSKEHWGLYFLEGSSFSVSACSRLAGALMSLIKGKKNLHRCLAEHRIRDAKPSESLESFESGDNSDGQTSSISSSQGVASNETEEWFACHFAKTHVILQPNYLCTSSVGLSALPEMKNALSYTVDKSDYYFLLFNSDTFLDILPNEAFVKMQLNRKTFNFEDSVSNCTNATECVFPFRFASREAVVVEVTDSNSTWKTSTMICTCQPRKGLYFLFYLAAGIVIFICAFQ